jgi:hypothetical protein
METKIPAVCKVALSVLVACVSGYTSPMLFEFTGKIRQITLMTDTSGRGHFTFQYFQTSPISGLGVAVESKFALIVDSEEG